MAGTRSEGQIHYKDIKTECFCFYRRQNKKQNVSVFCFVNRESTNMFCSNKLAGTYHVIIKFDFMCLFFFLIEKGVQPVGQSVPSHKLVHGFECRQRGCCGLYV